jgi:hypothetical protein
MRTPSASLDDSSKVQIADALTREGRIRRRIDDFPAILSDDRLEREKAVKAFFSDPVEI